MLSRHIKGDKRFLSIGTFLAVQSWQQRDQDDIIGKTFGFNIDVKPFL